MIKPLHIVTPCTRNINYLNRCYDSFKHIKYDWIWYIVINSNIYKYDLNILNFKNTIKITQNRKNKWNSLINEYLDNVNEESFIYFLDDDNLIHEDFNTALDKLYKEKFETILFSQYGKYGDKDFTRIANFSNIRVEGIDQGQIVYSRKLINDLRYWEDVYRGDGYFITEYMIRLRQQNKLHKVCIDNKILCYYNAQKWK